ncbi:hypothetical protein DW999_17205, partial [Ruminococcus sp. AM54-14NS]
ITAERNSDKNVLPLLLIILCLLSIIIPRYHVTFMLTYCIIYVIFFQQSFLFNIFNYAEKAA